MLSCSIRETFRIMSGPEIAPDHVAAERQRHAARALRPPFSKVDDLLQPVVLIGELPLVNQEPRLNLPFAHGVLNAIERHHDVCDVRVEKTQRQKRRGQRPGHGDGDSLGWTKVRLARATRIGPYLSPMLDPCGSRRYLSVRCA